MEGVLDSIVSLIFLFAFFFFIYYLLAMKSSYKSGLKIILLGIEITLAGGIMTLSPNSSLGGYENLAVIFGLIITILGLQKIIRKKIIFIINKSILNSLP